MAATKTKGGSVVGILVVAVIAAAALGWRYVPQQPRGGPEDDIHEKVTLRVDFSPKERINLGKTDERVNIVVACECVLVENSTERFSPWTKIVQIPRGAKLVLTATQTVKGVLSCSINGVEGGKVSGPGSAVCKHNH